ncbi:SDR family oxidoreductase [Telluribacter sp.]|jgi:uncharacterized protein YbjT (DUF2867 family)|uniref:SDR family oxidoreductase n=1 Tax=Telluribacter sp. TaxID=1978767 RepID=UPI002E1575DC|nr:SDR family oxidoreductase [Telluribacter sp.]
MVLLVGSTGVLGHETALHLLSADFKVRAMVRKLGVAKDLEEKGVELIQGDLTNPDSLVKACRGTEVVIAAAHGLLGRGKNKSENVDAAGHRSLIDAARTAGVKHLIYTSVFGANPDHPVDFYRTKYQTEEYLIGSGLTYTILRPSAFMEWHAHNLLGKNILQKGSTTILGLGTTPTNFVAARDIAQLITQSCQNPRLHNRVISIGGPTNPTRNEVAELYSRLAGVPPKVKHVPAGALQFLSRLIKPFHPGIGRIMFMSAILDQMDCSMDMTKILQDFPMNLTTMEDFVQEQVKKHREVVPLKQ